MKIRFFGLALLLALGACGSTDAAGGAAEQAETPIDGEGRELTVMVSGALGTPYAEVVPEFERRTGAQVVTVRGGSTGDSPNTIPNRMAAGEFADVVILAGDNLQELIDAGHVEADSRVDLAQVEVWTAVPKGMPRPDISTVEAFRQALISAPAVAVSSSVSGLIIRNEIVPQLGLSEEVGPKIVVVGAVGQGLIDGQATIGFQNYSELLPFVEGIDMIGPLPEELSIVTVFSTGRAAYSAEPELSDAFIQLFASPEMHDAIREGGLEPMGR